MIFDIKAIVITFSIMAGLVYIDSKLSKVKFNYKTFEFVEVK